MKTIAIVTSRWQSKRLPGKALKDICGEPLLQRVVDRVRQSHYINQVVVATTPSSQPIIDYCIKKKIDYLAGDEDDILTRLASVSLAYNPELIVRIWGDSPLIEPANIDTCVMYYLQTRPDYLFCETEGQAVGVLSEQLLRKVNGYLTSKEDRHWFHNYLKKNNKCISIAPRDGYFYTVDTQADLEKVRKVYGRL